MTRLLTWLLTLLLSGISLLAFAEQIDESCYLPADLCELQSQLDVAEHELTIVYNEIISRINADELPAITLVAAQDLKQSLMLSQQAWLNFKIANCDAFYTLNSGGSQRNEARMECEIAMVEARAIYLKQAY